MRPPGFECRLLPNPHTDNKAGCKEGNHIEFKDGKVRTSGHGALHAISRCRGRRICQTSETIITVSAYQIRFNLLVCLHHTNMQLIQITGYRQKIRTWSQ